MGFAFFAMTAAAVSTAPVTSASQAIPELDSPETALNTVVQKEPVKPTPEPAKKKATVIQEFEPFTGKITGSRVRVRLQPSLEGIIIKELNQGDMVIVTGEVDDFYAVRPEPKSKGFVYRAYVLDNVVEANNVNLRTEPDTTSPILTQLGQGDKVKGTLCPDNNKWLMIDLPETVRFYIAKDYLSNIGDASVYKRTQLRREQVASRLDSLESNIQTELKKAFSEIQLSGYVNDLKAIVAQNQDLPDLADKAQGLIKTVQEQYLQLSLGRTSESQATASKATSSPQIASLPTPAQVPSVEAPQAPRFSSFTLEQQELNLMDQALRAGKIQSKDGFYPEELKTAQEIAGQLVPYERPVKNRPGDFMLVDAKTKVPVAYLYSCQIDLNSFAGQTVRLMVSPRPNHHFALPAFVVLAVKRW